MWRFAPDDIVKVLFGGSGIARGGLLRTISQRFYLDDPGWHVGFCSGRLRKGCTWTIRGSMWRFAPDDFVKVLSGRCGVSKWRSAPDDFAKVSSGRSGLACGVLLRAMPKFYLNDPGWHGDVCAR